MKIVFAAHTHLRSVFVLGSHHLARTLAQAGHDVLHICIPVTPFFLLEGRDAEYRRQIRSVGFRRAGYDGRLSELVPVSLAPLRLARLTRGGSNRVISGIIPPLGWRLRALRFDKPDVLVIDAPLLHGIWKQMAADRIVYRAKDDEPAIARDPRLQELERAILNVADGVVAVSELVEEHVRDLMSRPIPSLILENGVAFDHFRAPAAVPVEYAAIPEPRVVYAGSFDHRFDWDAVQIAATARPGIHFILIGPKAVPPSALPSNVHLLGSRPYATLPGYLQHAQVGLLPATRTLANEGRSPLKLYEYAAAGIGAVAPPLAELVRRKDPFVTFYSNPSELPQALDEHLRRRPNSAELRSFARARDWKLKSESLVDFVAGLPGGQR